MSTLAERLGYAAAAKLLIIHCDDFGMCHSENAATTAVLERGVASSASIMTPCPWRDEAIAYAVAHPAADIGMHCTLTSEWRDFRWGPVASVDTVPSLVDGDGYLWREEEAFAAHADPGDVERELRAQYALLRERGVDVTHIDMHMEAIVSRPPYVDVYANLAQEWRVPFMLPNLSSGLRQIFDPDYQRISKETEDELSGKGMLVIDRLIMHVGEEADRGDFYARRIADLDPGLTQIITHVGLDTPEIRAAAVLGDGTEGYSYRFADYDALLDDRVRAAIAEHDVQLITWRDIRADQYG